MTTTRDGQRSRLYAAERSANLGGTVFYGTEQAQVYLDRLLATAWFQARWGRRRIAVRFVNGYAARAYQWHGHINMGVGSRCEWVMLHELAHMVTDSDAAPHGPEFAAAYLKLVAYRLGDNAAERLRAAFVERRVKHRARGAVPVPARSRVKSKSAVVAAARAERSKPVTASERTAAAAVLRRAVRNGVFGPTGRKPRAAALAVARELEAAS